MKIGVSTNFCVFSFFGLTIISDKPLLRIFKPHIHSWFQTQFFLRQTSPIHGPAWMGPPGNITKHFQERFLGIFEQVLWEHCKKFLGTKLFTWLHTAKKDNSQELFMEPDFLHGIKRRFPQRSQEHSQQSKPQVPGTCAQPAKGRGGGGVGKLPRTLGQPKEFHWTTRSICHVSLAMLAHSVRLARFQTPTISRPICWCKQHCDHASPKIAFQFARTATWNLSRHDHRNLDKEGTIINTARMRSWDCHKNKVSGKFQKFIWFYLEIFSGF